MSRTHRIDRAIGDIPHFDFRPGKSFWDGGLGICWGLGAIGIETPDIWTPFLHNAYNTRLSSAADFWAALSRAWQRCDRKIKEIADSRAPGIVDDPFSPIAIGDDKFEAIRDELSKLDQDQLHIDIRWGASSFSPRMLISHIPYQVLDFPYFYYNGEFVRLDQMSRVKSWDDLVWLVTENTSSWYDSLPINLYHATLHGWFDLWADHLDTPWTEYDAFNGKAKLVHVNKVQWNFPHVQKDLQ